MGGTPKTPKNPKKIDSAPESGRTPKKIGAAIIKAGRFGRRLRIKSLIGISQR